MPRHTCSTCYLFGVVLSIGMQAVHYGLIQRQAIRESSGCNLRCTKYASHVSELDMVVFFVPWII